MSSKVIASATLFSRSPNPHRLDKFAAHFGWLAVVVAEFLQALAQEWVLVEVGKREAFGVEFARHVGQRDAGGFVGAADDAARFLAVRHGFDLFEEAAAHHGNA